MVLPTDSIAGPVYRYDTEAISKRSSSSSVSVSSVTYPPSIPHIHPSLLASLDSLPGGALLLDLLVIVVAGVGPRNVVAVPNAWLETQISVTCVGSSCSRVVVPEGVAEGEAKTCRRLVPPSSCQIQPDPAPDEWGRKLTQRNAEIGDEAPAEHLQSRQLLLILLSFRSGGAAAIGPSRPPRSHVRQ